MFQPIDWSRFPQDFPATFVISTVCILMFLAYHLGLMAPQISLPGILSVGAYTAHFFHASPLHLLSNMIIIIFMGVLLERHLGWWRYTLLVLLVWNLTVLGLFLVNPYPALGFSGIGLGLMVLAYFYWQDVPQNAQMLGVLIVINILFGLMPGVSWHGHLMGAISGVIVYGIIRLAQIGQKH